MSKFGDSEPATHQGALDAAGKAPGQSGGHTPAHSPNYQTTAPAVTPFPTHFSTGSRLRLDKSGVTPVIRGVDQDTSVVNTGLNQLNGNGVLAGVVGGGWPVADNLSVNASNANYGIAAFTQRLAEAYSQMGGAMQTAVKKINDADATIAGAAKHVNTDIETG